MPPRCQNCQRIDYEIEIEELRYQVQELQEQLVRHDATQINNSSSNHEDRPTILAARVGLKDRLLHALDLNGGRVKIEVVDFHGSYM
ncbi:Uncharacterized protein TCM_039150 [Theobroma cacao]|uniref:Uncharacterized protein n=1 Tax=Theobroma cacao TaxID=3641 RepID=A0A061GXK5_THECC|nr:Uncharacterized protein TCM_039150 [Theobroma cacao]